MQDLLLDEINQIKKDMVVAFTRYSLSGEDHQSVDAILNSVLISWFENVHNSQDFDQKYHSFKQLEKMIADSMLLDMVDTISSSTDIDQARHASAIYFLLTQEEDYQKLIETCGYKLPSEFGNVYCYFDGTLKQNVQFFHQFVDRLDKIKTDLSMKGGNHI